MLWVHSVWKLGQHESEEREDEICRPRKRNRKNIRQMKSKTPPLKINSGAKQ